MVIKCEAWNPSIQETMTLDRWLVLEQYNEPLNAADNAINIAEIGLKIDGCNPDITTTITIPLDEYRLLISDAQKKAKEEGCKEGRGEAWDLARRIGTCGDDCYAYDEAHDVFENRAFGQILRLPVEEVLAKDKKHQEDKKALHVGDEVKFRVPDMLICGYVTKIRSCESAMVLTKDGITHLLSISDLAKTGNHSEEIEKAMASFEKGES